MAQRNTARDLGRRSDAVRPVHCAAQVAARRDAQRAWITLVSRDLRGHDACVARGMNRILALLLVLFVPDLAAAQEAESPAVIASIQRADVAAQNGDARGAALMVREAQRADRGSRAARVARIALGHRLLPGVALRLDAMQLSEVIDHDTHASINHTLGHVFGIVGAAGGVVALLFGFIGAVASTASGGSGSDLGPVVGAFGGGGLAFAVVGVLFHVAGSSNDADAEAMLQLTPTANGASLMFSGRF